MYVLARPAPYLLESRLTVETAEIEIRKLRPTKLEIISTKTPDKSKSETYGRSTTQVRIRENQRIAPRAPESNASLMG
jgi:hypothetical protein